jgi:hypothetical protein
MGAGLGCRPGAGKLSWITLGSATSAESRPWRTAQGRRHHGRPTTDPADASYTKIPFNGKFNWVRVKPGMEKAAAFLETHRYAAWPAAAWASPRWKAPPSTPSDKIAYSAMSYVQTSMLNGSGHIKVEGPKAGAVYALNLRGGQRDAGGNAIDSEWVPRHGPPAALVGVDLKTPMPWATWPTGQDRQPGQHQVLEKLRTLFIGEDSGMHVNNFLWAYNVDTKALTRVLSCPAGPNRPACTRWTRSTAGPTS